MIEQLIVALKNHVLDFVEKSEQNEIKGRYPALQKAFDYAIAEARAQEDLLNRFQSGSLTEHLTTLLLQSEIDSLTHLIADLQIELAHARASQAPGGAEKTE